MESMRVFHVEHERATKVCTNKLLSQCVIAYGVDGCDSRETRTVRLYCRRHLHSAVIATAFALGRYSRVIREKEVDDTAL
jgi:hypothetical protein